MSVEINSCYLLFSITVLCDWLKKFVPLSCQIRSTTKMNHDLHHTFSCALWQLNVFVSSFDWFTGLSVLFVIGQSDYFVIGFMALY